MPQLHPEIWAHVLSFLKRPLPTSETTEWSDLHQHDLTVAMRVNTVSAPIEPSPPKGAAILYHLTTSSRLLWKSDY
jgi:L,D-peptidoglycan transpeptidase YkuD (ErfK/YbiS/YcfS/YnhG family)